ncbi:MAG TPA: efflux transporter outer membrane subunit [Gemmataceae bacterium]|nr:efflux transporter outer membrane subunit [Gemmataceae bacterium]
MRRRTCCWFDARDARRPRILRSLAMAGGVVAVFLASGCVATGPLTWIENGFKVGPNYHRPPAPVAPEWIEAQDTRVQGHQLPNGEWWNVFQDPILNSLINTAYQQNLSLRVLGTRVLEARAQQAIAVGNIFPQTQQATGQYSRVNLSRNAPNNPTSLGPFLQTVTNRLGLPPSRGGFVNNFSDWLFGFNLSWELDFWGRFRRAIESANATLDASVENYDDGLVTLLADVATNYVQYRVAQQRIRIARDNIRIQQGLVALVERQQKVGTATSLDVEQLRTLLEQTRSTVPALQITLGQANDTLCILLGIPPRDLEPDLGPGPELGREPMPNTPNWAAAGIPADLLRQRPDVRSAERQVAAQSAQIGVAEADLYPTFFLNGTLGWEAQDLSKLFEGNSFFGTIMPQFKWNILNYGRIVNNVRVQDARTLELIASYQNRVLTAAREVQTALRGFLRSQEQAEDLARSARAAVAATKIQEKLSSDIKNDAAAVNRLFTLENTQVQEQDNLAVAQGNIALNLINVYRALGGGWEIRWQDGHWCQVRITGVAPVEAPPGADAQQLPQPRPVPQPR